MAPALLGLTILALPYFTEATANLGTPPCGGGGCFTNYIALADIDGDDDLDLLVPNADGYFSQGTAEPLIVLENDGAATFADISAAAVGSATGWIRQLAIGDIDGDGDLDLFAPDAWGGDDRLYVNDGLGTFTDEAATRIASQSRAGAARFGDVDGDADLDLLVTDWGPDPFGAGAISGLFLYLNDGAGNFTDASAQLPTVAAPDGTTPIDIDFFDADGDFDLDVLVDSHEDNERLLLNDGAGTFTDASASFPDGGNLSYGPTVCDVDADGDLDVAIDNARGSNSEQLFENLGGGSFSDVSVAALPTENDDDNGVVCVDVDNDGDMDLVIPSLSGDERVLENDGSGDFTALVGGFPGVNDSTLWMDFGDLNGDGRLDAVTGQGESGSFVDRLYLGTTDQPVDDRPPVFRAVQVDDQVSPGTALTVRFAVRDSHSTDIGPRLARAWLVFVVNSGAAAEATASFVGGDLFQATSTDMPATGAGTYHVCATDVTGNSACSTPDLAFSIAPGGDDDDDDDDDGTGNGGDGGGGCACRAATAPSSLPLSALLTALGVAVLLFRRRQ